MPYRRTDNATQCRIAALGLVVVVALVRLFYLASSHALDLAPDEAHYWDWSRHLDWSYYSKGPLVAWLIRASCELFGPLSVHLTGTEMMAVRLPAVVCGTLLLVSLYVLTVQVFGCEKLALGVVAIALTMPLVAAGSSLMTIDAPYTCCWGWALVLAHRAVFRGSLMAWVLTGLVVALGILAKYNMAAFIPSLGMFLLCSRKYRVRLLQPGFWLMSVIAALGLLPILLWNIHNDWVTFAHVNALASGMKQEKSFYILGPLVYVGGQFALLLGFWFVAWVQAMVGHRPWKESDAGKQYLWWMSLPMFAVFLVFSFKTGGGELNWPVTAYLSGVILAAGRLVDQFATLRPLGKRVVLCTLLFVSALGIVLTLAVHRSDWFRPLLLSMAGPKSESNPFPARRFDPSCRLRGWQTLAKEVDLLREELRAAGVEPILAGTSWTMPGELGFYCEGHPTVYSFGLACGDRHSQYDLWRPNPLADPEQFLGKTFIVVGCPTPELRQAFGRIRKFKIDGKFQQVKTVIHKEDGVPIGEWTIMILEDYRGVKALEISGRRF